MALDPKKFKRIVSGITTPADPIAPAAEPVDVTEEPNPVSADVDSASVGPAPDPSKRGRGEAEIPTDDAPPAQPTPKRFAKTGRPRGSKTGSSGKINKTKVTLFLDEQLVNELYEWAHQDRMHPGELFDRALRTYRDREVKRRNAGTE